MFHSWRTPETFVKNRMALEHYRAIKKDGARLDINNLESKTLYQDEVIRGVQKREKVKMAEEDAINWNAPL